jgi:hypothetical protein
MDSVIVLVIYSMTVTTFWLSDVADTVVESVGVGVGEDVGEDVEGG